jgi:Protease inhibitor Inh
MTLRAPMAEGEARSAAIRRAGLAARPWAAVIGVLLVCGLAGCAERIGGLGGGSNNAGGTGTTAALPAAPTGPVTSAPLSTQGAARTPPPIAMAGRWTLTSPGSGGCAMNFGGNPGAAEGTIAPEGGCPGNFFTSRKWVFEESGLVIRDHTGQPLARLALGTSGRFDGQAATGQPVSLAR